MNEAVARAARFLRHQARELPAPRVLVIAGSGLSELGARVEEGLRVPYRDIPGWPVSTVAGHAGELALGRLGDVPCAVACGRAHLYEGYSPQELVFGLRTLAELGPSVAIVTNAAGSLRQDLSPGEVMLLEDHLFLPGIAGMSPLVGPNDPAKGPRFPSMLGAYDPELRAAARAAFQAEGLSVQEGVYAMVAGPSFETPAEARMLRALGADAVGMSTAPEVVAARHLGLRVLGASLVSNRVALRWPEPDAARAVTPDGEALHEEVKEMGAKAAPRLAAGIARLVGGLGLEADA